MTQALSIVVIGLAITSAWGNGHATTYRGLLRELAARGHGVRFYERDVPWYAEHRDMPSPDGVGVILYQSTYELVGLHRDAIEHADVVIVGSYVPDGAQVVKSVLEIARGLVAFYDIDTPVTLMSLAQDGCEYLDATDVPRLDLYLSFSGGGALRTLERDFGAKRAAALYCSADEHVYYPDTRITPQWLLGYLGTYSADRQPTLDQLLLEPARQLPSESFVVAGPQYPPSIAWPSNVARTEHVAPPDHRRFYAMQRFTLNVTRHDMRVLGWSPSIRLFEAAACGVPIVSDTWPGLDELFAYGREILPVRGTADALRALTSLPEDRRLALGRAARERVLAEHTAAHRAADLERELRTTLDARAARTRRPSSRVVATVSGEQS